MDKTFEENMIAVYLIGLNSDRPIPRQEFPTSLQGVVATQFLNRRRLGLDPITGYMKSKD